MDHRTVAVPAADHLAPHLLAAAAYVTSFLNPNTRDAYTRDLRIYFAWCELHHLPVFGAHKAHLQAFVLHLLQERGNRPASVARRIHTVTGYYAYAVDEGYLDATPAHRVKLPKIVEDPGKLTWLTRFELGAVLHAAKASKHPADLALIHLLGTLGMRVSAACAVQVQDITTNPDGYRILRTVGKGDKPSLKALPIPVAQAVDLAAAGRTTGPLLLRRDGTQMTRRSAARVITRLVKAAGVEKTITPHSLRRSHATLALQAGVDLRVVQDSMDHSSSRTTLRYDRIGVPIHAQASHTLAAMLASAS